MKYIFDFVSEPYIVVFIEKLENHQKPKRELRPLPPELNLLFNLLFLTLIYLFFVNSDSIFSRLLW